MLSTTGILGRLGDLGSINAEYDVAISTACSMLDHIVVQTVEDGEACIRYLRQNNLGRASFIALSQMEQWKQKYNKTICTPENTPRLIDLVTPNSESLLPVFYFALRDTLVASDLDTATRLAYEGDRARWRIVTQDGTTYNLYLPLTYLFVEYYISLLYYIIKYVL